MANSPNSHNMATSHSSQTDFEEAPRLKGHLNSNGISRLEIDTSESSRAGLNSLRTAIQVSANSSSGESETASSPSDQGDIEDYDTLRTMAHNSNRAEKRSYDGDETLEKVNNPRHSELKKGVTKPAFKKMKSIPVILKKSDQEGKYFLRADDAEIRKLLKMGIERVQEHLEIHIRCYADMSKGSFTQNTAEVQRSYVYKPVLSTR